MGRCDFVCYFLPSCRGHKIFSDSGRQCFLLANLPCCIQNTFVIQIEVCFSFGYKYWSWICSRCSKCSLSFLCTIKSIIRQRPMKCGISYHKPVITLHFMSLSSQVKPSLVSPPQALQYLFWVVRNIDMIDLTNL